MPKALHIASKVGMEGMEFLLNMLHTVLICNPLSFDKRYIVQPRSSMSCRILASTSIAFHPIIILPPLMCIMIVTTCVLIRFVVYCLIVFTVLPGIRCCWEPL